MQRKHVVVHGVVQGVGFRYSARAEAVRWRLGGFAQNTAAGTVVVEIEGEEADVASMLEWLASGPPSAVVEDLFVTEAAITGETMFRVIG